MFLLPLASTVLLGYVFDLRSYNFKRGTVYNYDDIKSLTQITEINEFSAEYKLIESEVEYRKFLGLDVATNLKTLVNYHYYPYKDELKEFTHELSDKLHMALKLSLRTVNETVPFDAPQQSGWELKDSRFIGTHYVKSIIYGSEVFLVLFTRPRNSSHKAAIKRSILSKLGKSGTLDESFQEKFQAIIKENGPGHGSGYSSFGTLPFSADVTRTSIGGMLKLKQNLAAITKTINDGKGDKLFYEMQPISLLSSKFPLVEINSQIIKKLYDVENKYEDLRIAKDEFGKWLSRLPIDLWEEAEMKMNEFYEELKEARSDMVYAIRDMDVSTLGNVDQFSKAMSSYGNTTDTQKYRTKMDFLRKQYPPE